MELLQELCTKQSLKECNVCKENETKLQTYEDEIEKEVIVECQKALEREKIAKGMQCGKEDELRLREIQKRQMEEKKYREKAENDIEKMWHQVLLKDIKFKEKCEQIQNDRKREDMLKLRMAYDKQVADINRKKEETIKIEREKENRRLDRLKKKMDQDYLDDLKRKREQQLKNKINFIEGHNLKLQKVKTEKLQEREIDNRNIERALDQLNNEKLRKVIEIQQRQRELQIFLENFERERKMSAILEKNIEDIANQWTQQKERNTVEYLNNVKEQNIIKKKKSAEEYRKYMEERAIELEKNRIERAVRMDHVKKRANEEMQTRLKSANEELNKQIEYRNNLRNQIHINQTLKAAHLRESEIKERTFTRKADMFRDVMNKKVDKSPKQISTNPVHPFKRIIESRHVAGSSVQLPFIGRNK